MQNTLPLEERVISFVVFVNVDALITPLLSPYLRYHDVNTDLQGPVKGRYSSRREGRH